MSEQSDNRSAEFLKICEQFQLGALTTESSHPLTAKLSDVAKDNVAAGLGLLFDVDDDVVRTYRDFAKSGRAQIIQKQLLACLRNGGRLFFTGCGSTGRLSIQIVSIWRDFWRKQGARGLVYSPSSQEMENRAFSVMAGGDFALIKAVEGFEDFTEFGKKQIADLGVSERDTVFAITEGGETSFVIGTAWKGVEAGAKVYFVYNNPDDILCERVQRSRGIVQDSRVEKINLTTGPMAITGSTRMQATSIQLCVLVTVLEMVLREWINQSSASEKNKLDPLAVPQLTLQALTQMRETLKSPSVLQGLAEIVGLEERVYRDGFKNNYFADRFGIDVLTDTTERSPTYCTPPFRKFDDQTATESWAYLFVPQPDSTRAWSEIIKRAPACIEWSETEVRSLVPDEKVARTLETVRKIGPQELMRFKVGLDGLQHRLPRPGNSAVAIIHESEKQNLLSPDGFFRIQLEAAKKAGAQTGLIFIGSDSSRSDVAEFLKTWDPLCILAFVPVPTTDLLLDGGTRIGLKMLLNAVSTCTMVRLGRVMGNFMIWVVPSNLKLIDRATRYIQKLSGLDYPAANELLFEVIEYVEPRMKADQAYPPVVGVSVLRARENLTNEQAEQRLLAGI